MPEKSVITGPSGAEYIIDRMLGGAEFFTMYLCRLSDGRECLLKIATDAAHNGMLDREAFLLNHLRAYALELESEFATGEGKSKEEKLNYQFSFPRVLESFVIPEQGDRRASVLDFSDICEELGELVPLEHIMTRARQRIDPRTSAWILGKLLKIIDFAHDNGIVLGDKINGQNILINRDQHFVALFDWSGLPMEGSRVEPGLARLDIRAATEAVIASMGGDLEARKLPPDDQLVGNGYEDHIFDLVDGDSTSAYQVHQDHYKLVYAIWPRAFHPFTAHAVD